MSKELVIGSNRHETKVAILEEDQLVEVYFQRANEYSLAGSIHKGRVTRVLPGMQSAFVDLGLERDTFLVRFGLFRRTRRHRHGRRKAARAANAGSGVPTGVVSGAGGERGAKRTVCEPPQSRTSGSRTGASAGSSGRSRVSGTDLCRKRRLADERARCDPGCSRRSQRSGTNRRRAKDSGETGGTGAPAARRQRGRGFPENKYAQPGETVTGSSAADCSGTSPGEPAGSQRARGPTREVVVLPGESLAKYRHATPEPAKRPSNPPVPARRSPNRTRRGSSQAEASSEEPFESSSRMPSLIRNKPKNARRSKKKPKSWILLTRSSRTTTT